MGLPGTSLDRAGLRRIERNLRAVRQRERGGQVRWHLPEYLGEHAHGDRIGSQRRRMKIVRAVAASAIRAARS